VWPFKKYGRKFNYPVCIVEEFMEVQLNKRLRKRELTVFTFSTIILREICFAFKLALCLIYNRPTCKRYLVNFNLFKPIGNYMSHLLQQSTTLHSVSTCFVGFSLFTAIISLNSIKKLIFVMVKCCVFFAVRTGFLNIT
jgi:hypothetical protein